jgi:hypothetical protein
MGAAAFGWLAPVPAAIFQEVIDVAVILNALRALRPSHRHVAVKLPADVGRTLHHDHVALIRSLDRLQSITDALDDAVAAGAIALIVEARNLVWRHVVAHERADEGDVYPRLSKILAERVAFSAMSRAHREILHLARLLDRLVEDLPADQVDRYLIRDAQRIIDAIEKIVRLHTAQEDDIYGAASQL